MREADLRPRIVVGVDGSEAALTAVRYAAMQAVRTGSDLVIAHAGPDSLHLGDAPMASYPLTPREYRGLSTKVLNHARTVAREVAGDHWEIRTAIVDGESPATALARHAVGARLLVVGGQRRPLTERLLAGSVAHGVAGHARVPVIVVPEDWSADPPHGVVAVGVCDLEGGEGLLRDALAIAAERDATLHVVHAWSLPERYHDVVTHLDVESAHADTMRELEDLVGRVKGEHPHVGVDVSLLHSPPAKALVATSRVVDLVVLGRRRHGIRHLGATTRAVLREAHCPVEVLPPLDQRPVSPWQRTLDPALVG